MGINLHSSIGRYYLASALFMLVLGLVFGVVAAFNYIIPGFSQEYLGFIQLRPMHVSCVMFFILMGACGCIYCGLQSAQPDTISKPLAYMQLVIWWIAIIAILFSYSQQQFGGREYWEFPPKYALIIAITWVLFLVNYFIAATKIKKWPVYIWMWMTGIIFFLFTFLENYLWEFPYFREHFLKDLTIQWKANGSLVGSWNQMIYGTAFFLMERISGERSTAKSNLAFALYFLGLFNLMFNWGHHIYTLPTESYIRYVSYIVSMTEWIFLLRIFYTFKSTVTTARKNYYYFPYRFLLASEVWIFFNMMLAIVMSIPAFNLYTHGTHVTVAHAMGTTIGINTMILIAACFEFFMPHNEEFAKGSKVLNVFYWMLQIGLLLFWLSLIIIGIQKGIWQMGAQTTSFSSMMQSLQAWFYVFVSTGIILMASLSSLAFILLHAFLTKKKYLHF
ncbi:MAG: cbb3-type cytochrome c oxidase subunit I [Bacteroidota bacterium]|nr:cbb3-type cytochrome c oxidase subunit I [Bacteroidota bacterium]